MSDSPVIVDPTAVLPPQVTAYRRDLGCRLDGPGRPHRDHRYVDTDLGERIISGLMNHPAAQRNKHNTAVISKYVGRVEREKAGWIMADGKHGGGSGGDSSGGKDSDGQDAGGGRHGGGGTDTTDNPSDGQKPSR